jgi:hypothetical protein
VKGDSDTGVLDWTIGLNGRKRKGKEMYVRFMIVIMALLVLAGTSAATIDASSRAAGASNLALEYPELKIMAIGTKFELTTRVVAGRYLVTVDNQGEEGVDAQFVQVPEGRTVEELDHALADPNDNAAWLYETTWAGGPTVLAGKQGQTIIDLTAGNWAIVADGYSPSSLMVIPAYPGSPAKPDPEVAATIELQEYSFAGLTDSIQPGKQIWKITNVGEQPHFLELIKAPGPVTVEQVLDMLMSSGDPSATPAPGALDPSTIEGVGGIGTISPGQTGWYVTDLEPGTYVALCFVPDRESGMPHVMMGMVQVFTVAD